MVMDLQVHPASVTGTGQKWAWHGTMILRTHVLIKLDWEHIKVPLAQNVKLWGWQRGIGS